MSALPKAVQKQIAAANQLAEQLDKQRQAAATPENLTKPDSETQVAPPAPAGEQSSPAPTPAPATEGWEQKYRVLQGKYNAEVPRMQRTVNEQTAAIEQLRQQLTATQQMLASLGQRGAAPAQQGATPAPQLKLVKDEEVETFGSDLTDFIKRVAQDAVMPTVEERLQPMRQQVEQVRNVAGAAMQRTAHTDQERLLATLDRDIPGWREQNEDPLFLEWLNQSDPYTGRPRMEFLTEAYQRFDAPRVVAFFKGYRNENAAVTPPSGSAAPDGAPQRSLESFVAPGSARTGAAGAPNGAGKRIWTQAEIKRFYDECTAGKYRSNLERRRQIEQDIVDAAREGRVR